MEHGAEELGADARVVGRPWYGLGRGGTDWDVGEEGLEGANERGGVGLEVAAVGEEPVELGLRRLGTAVGDGWGSGISVVPRAG